MSTCVEPIINRVSPLGSQMLMISQLAEVNRNGIALLE